jgi:hypothetical protein
MPVQQPEVHERESASPEARWALLQRVVASPQLRRAARMREFLLFVGQRTLKDGSEQIHEQEIGCEVFGRPLSYDTSVDNIVRVNATDLRKRIEEYFATDGALEPLVLEIPRGSYKPVFRARAVEAAPHPVPEPQQPQPVPDIVQEARPSSAAPDARLLWLAGAAVLALSVVCAFLWMQNQALSRPLYTSPKTPAIASFWSGVFGARPATDVILADTSFALIEDITKKPIPLSEYLNRDYIGETQSPALGQERREDLALIVRRNYGSLGDFRVAQRINALDPLAKNIRLYYARDYRPDLVKQDSVILIGSRKSNPWVDLFADRMNFTVEYDPDRFVSYIKNRAPAAGEQAAYNLPPSSDPTTGYCVVAYLPNPDQGGKVLIIAGTGSEATEGAGEFLTSEASLEDFKKLLHVSTLPYFEVLLKTAYLNSTPMRAQVVAYRTYPNLR